MFCTFLDRAATKPDLILSDKSEDVRVSVGLCSAGTIANDNSDTTKMMMVDLSAMTAEHQDPTIEVTESSNEPTAAAKSNSKSGSGNAANTDSGNDGKGGSSAAKTGDPLNALPGVLAVTAAAGAAMAAYSKRRIDNERAKAAEGEDD